MKKPLSLFFLFLAFSVTEAQQTVPREIEVPKDIQVPREIKVPQKDEAPEEERAPRESPATSGCHAFIDYQFIWTLEMVPIGGSSVPILNIITFLDGEWDLRPEQVHLSTRFQDAEIKKFAIDTGVPGEPYVVQYLKVQGDSFIGMDLIGELHGLSEFSDVTIELGDSVFELKAVDCLAFENVAHQINQINFDSPDIRQDYEVLNIDLMGERKARRRFY